MAVLLALCVGAVSAADADIANGGMAEVAVSPVSEDISVLADGEDPDDIRINSSDENQTVTVKVNETSIFVPEDKIIVFDVDVLNNSESIDFTKDDLNLTLWYKDTEDPATFVDITEFNLTDKSISFSIPENITNPLLLDILYQNDIYSANANITLKRIHNITIEVPSFVYVDTETKTGNFNIKVLDVDSAISFTDKDLVITYIVDGTELKFITDETLFKEGTNETVVVDGVRYIRVIKEIKKDNETINETIDYPVSDYTTLREVIREVTREVTKEVFDNETNQTVNQTFNETVNETFNETIYYPVAYTLKDGVISFRIPGNDSGSQELNIVYKNQNLTPEDIKKDIVLKIVTGNNINVETTSQLELNKTVEFTITVTDKDGKLVFINQEDFELFMIYYGDNFNSDQIKIGNFTLTPSKYDEIKNESNETIGIENITEWKISFQLPVLDDGNNYTNGKLNITYKNNSSEEAFITKNVAFVKINILNDESATEYQNDYIMVQLWNNYLNASVAGKSIRFSLEESPYGVTFEQSTDSEGKYKIQLDTLYSFGQSYIPVGTYHIIVSTNSNDVMGPTISKNCTTTIHKVQAILTVTPTSIVYGSGTPLVIKLVNAKTKKGIVGSKITFKIYSNKKWNTATVTTGADGKATIRLNGFGAGTYNVQAINNNTGNVIATAAQPTITIKAIKNAKISAKATTAYYNYGSQFKVKMTNSKGVALKGAIVLLNIYTGKKYKAVTIMTDDKGYAYWTVSGISIAKHKVLIGSGSTGATSNVVQTYITLKKGKTTVSAPKVINKYKKSAYFKITIKNKGTKKPLKGIYLKVKVYTGKKYKTYTIKTNSKGVASLNTKALKKGTHKVVITTTNKKYTVSKSGKLIVIK